MVKDPPKGDPDLFEESEIAEKADKPKRLGLVGRLRNYFLAGLLVTAPIVITIYVVWVVVNFVDSRVTPLIPAQYNPKGPIPGAHFEEQTGQGTAPNAASLRLRYMTTRVCHGSLNKMVT